MRLIFLLACLIPFLSADQAASNIKLDGKISEGERKSAEQHELKNGGKILIKQHDNDLYVALISKERIWTHVYLSDGNTVNVMHASAALGAVLYKKDQAVWRTIDSFKFELRDTTYNDQLISAQDNYYRSHGWVATNGNMATGKVFEFKLDLTRFPKPTYLACVMSNYNSEFSWFPATVNDDTLLKRLVQGNTPDSLNFKPDQWKKIR